MSTSLRRSSLKSLFSITGKIFSFVDSNGMASEYNDFVPVTKSTNKLVAISPEMTDEELNKMIMGSFSEYRELLFANMKNNTWIAESEIKFFFTEKHKIQLSRVYKMALDIREKVKAQLEGMPKTAYEGRQELIFADIFRFHLYQVFYRTLDEKNDKDRIAVQVAYLEDLLGIDISKSTLPEEARKKKGIGMMGDNPMEGIMKIAGGFMNNPKIKEALAKGDNGELSPELIGDLLGGAFKDGPLKDTLGDVMSGFKEGKDPSELISKMTGLMGNKDASKQMENLMKNIIGGGDSSEESSMKVNGITNKQSVDSKEIKSLNDNSHSLIDLSEEDKGTTSEVLN